MSTAHAIFLNAMKAAKSPEPLEGEVKVAALTSVNLFQHPDAHPVILDLLLLRKYGPEWLLWSPDTLAIRIPQDFKTSAVSDLNLDKIQAMRTLHVRDEPWQEWELFVWCCMPINGEPPDFEVMQVPTAVQAAVAVDVFNRIRDDVQWSEEMKAYMGAVLRESDVLCPIRPVDFAQLDVDPDDLIVDCSAVQERWPSVKMSGKAPTTPSPENTQLQRMLVMHTAVQQDRELQETQAKALAL